MRWFKWNEMIIVCVFVCQNNIIYIMSVESSVSEIIANENYLYSYCFFNLYSINC